MRMRFVFSIVCAYCFCVFHASAQTAYRLTDGSSVKISGTSTLSDWTVTSSKLAGQMIVQGAKVAGAMPAGEVTTAEVNVEVASIHSERGETMDNKIYKALKRDEFPAIRFLLREPVQLKNTGQPGTFIVARGDISIAGVTKDISFRMEVSNENGTWVFSGKKALKMSDFAIEPPSAMFGQITTGDDLEIDVDLIFTPGTLK